LTCIRPCAHDRHIPQVEEGVIFRKIDSKFVEMANTVVVKTEEEVISKLCSLIERFANKAIEREDVFKVGLSG